MQQHWLQSGLKRSNTLWREVANKATNGTNFDLNSIFIFHNLILVASTIYCHKLNFMWLSFKPDTQYELWSKNGCTPLHVGLIASLYRVPH